ncbi:hypothetical protein AVEN_208813-1 [Araneus ventricosus]|uniref:Uncharacterized protein n=1 Tax=Araneus ventricosus TaxID=182803 RepID=A0A4Y2SQ79_ARAVE|nr:hypothetical protein AVEN_208813-1 [Araneus ventricosus]
MQAIKNQIKIPVDWSRCKSAASDWLPAFLKCKKSLSLSTSQVTRLSRATSFDRNKIVTSFTNFASVQDIFKFQNQDIYSVYKSGVTTLLPQDIARYLYDVVRYSECRTIS